MRNVKKGSLNHSDWLTSLFDKREAEVQTHVPHPSNVENILRMDAEIAKEEHDRSRTQFLKLCFVQAGDSGRPEIRKSSRRLQLAGEVLMLATKRLNDFIFDGTVSENLLNGLQDCAECDRLLAQYARLEQAYEIAVETLPPGMGTLSVREYMRLRTAADEARIDLGVAHLKLEQHKRIHTKAN